MHPSIYGIKQRLSRLDSISDKLACLENAFAGEEAVVCTCGPSLGTFDLQALRDWMAERLVFSVKQAQSLFPVETDFHLVNDVNCTRYTYKSPTIVVFEKSWTHRPVYNVAPDIILNVDTRYQDIPDPTSRHEQWLVRTREFDRYMLNVNPLRPWGPSILIEVGIYLWVHLGLKRVTCLGWDVGNSSKERVHLKHFYDQSAKRVGPKLLHIARTLLNRSPRFLTKTSLFSFIREHRFFFDHILGYRYHVFPVDRNENPSIIEASEFVYKWLKQNGVDLVIGSPGSSLSGTIPRVEIEL